MHTLNAVEIECHNIMPLLASKYGLEDLKFMDLDDHQFIATLRDDKGFLNPYYTFVLQCKKNGRYYFHSQNITPPSLDESQYRIMEVMRKAVLDAVEALAAKASA